MGRQSRAGFLALTIIAIVTMVYGGYRYWFYEEPRAIGDLARELNAHFDDDDPVPILNAIVARHLATDMTIDRRRSLFERNGFDCIIKPSYGEGSRILVCRRPVEGRRYCQRINYVAYQTAAGKVMESLAAPYTVKQSSRVLGRCPYDPPAIDD